MWRRLLWALFILMVILPASGRAESSELDGTWSGSWITKKGYEACTVRFESEGGRLTGRMLSPTNVEFTKVTFDRKSLKVTASAENPERGNVEVIARIEETTRLNGTMTHDDMTGELRLTKWTFRP